MRNALQSRRDYMFIEKRIIVSFALSVRYVQQKRYTDIARMERKRLRTLGTINISSLRD